MSEGGGKKPVHFRVASRFKRLVQSTRYKRSPYVARTALRTPVLRRPVVSDIRKVVARECVRLCQKKRGGSLFRLRSISGLKAYSMKDLKSEESPCSVLNCEKCMF